MIKKSIIAALLVVSLSLTGFATSRGNNGPVKKGILNTKIGIVKPNQYVDEYLWVIADDGCLHLVRHEYMQIGPVVVFEFWIFMNSENYIGTYVHCPPGGEEWS